MKILRRFVTLFPILVLLVAGCGRQSAPKPPTAGHALAAPLVAQCEPGQPGGRLTLVIAGSPRSFNPLLAMDSASDQVVRMLFGSLLNVDLTTQAAGPGLAES
jgi:ABC-type transport system substrate-binding protein